MNKLRRYLVVDRLMFYRTFNSPHISSILPYPAITGQVSILVDVICYMLCYTMFGNFLSVSLAGLVARPSVHASQNNVNTIF